MLAEETLNDTRFNAEENYVNILIGARLSLGQDGCERYWL